MQIIAYLWPGVHTYKGKHNFAHTYTMHGTHTVANSIAILCLRSIQLTLAEWSHMAHITSLHAVSAFSNF